MTEATNAELAESWDAVSETNDSPSIRALARLTATRLRSDPPVDEHYLDGVTQGMCVARAFNETSVRARALEEADMEQLAIKLAHHVIIGLLDQKGGGQIVEQLDRAFFDKASASAIRALAGKGEQ
jgi:hypothetical protein